MKAANSFIFFLSAASLLAQPQAAQQPAPVYRVTVVSRTMKAINYHHRSGTTQIDFRGTELMPMARGGARVESTPGSTKIQTHLDRMTPAGQFGPEFLTYVLWAITPEGRATNLGEVVLDGNHSDLTSTTDLQSFGLMVTAEPYFAVTRPSDVVVAENFVRKDSTGTIEEVDAKYDLLQRGQYVLDRGKYHPVKIDPKGPLQLAEAENAIQIATIAGADRYAADTMQKAQLDFQNAQNFLDRGHDRKRSETNAREAAQMAEDARLIAVKKIQDEQTAADQRRRAQAEADRQAAETAKAEAQVQADRAAEARAAAEAERRAAVDQQAVLKAEADRARIATLQAQADQQRAEAEKSQIREQLRQQLNTILETRETARGLIVNISDVLFDFNKYSLKPEAREKMAKVAGILLAHPDLKIQLEGHTDSIGTDEYNQTLSEHRADAVRDYLVQQSVPAASLTAVGLGKANPVASNDSAAERQKNRRVEMVVSGSSIGKNPTQPAEQR